MKDLLEPLVRALQYARNVIDDDNHREYVRKHETRTRNILVDPVLKALGWDVSTIGDVEVEYGTGDKNKRADYALLGANEEPLVLVEAKKLDLDLNSNRTQMLTYCTEVGAQYGVLTDGNCWDLYDLWQEGSLDDRRILQLILSSRKPEIAARMLLRLWKPIIREKYQE